MAGTCVNWSAAIPALNTISHDRGPTSAQTSAVQLSARLWSGDITSVRLSVEKTGNGSFKAEMMAMRSELGRALSPEQSLSEVRTPQCESSSPYCELIARLAAAKTKRQTFSRMLGSYGKWRRNSRLTFPHVQVMRTAHRVGQDRRCERRPAGLIFFPNNLRAVLTLVHADRTPAYKVRNLGSESRWQLTIIAR